ncbi:MAG: bifunctional phosphoribosyl-AMP cyclohydrolase/phosphoribosyl-ATP diphosphatase HisIE [Candidatus Methylomirabilales bacterium]
MSAECRVPGAEPELRFDAAGLIPAIAQDAVTGQVLMHAYMDAEALARTRETGLAHYWSRSRKRLWQKGEESGHVQRVREIRYDCDADTLLLLIDQAGVACHTGERSCFYRRLPGAGPARDTAALDLFQRLYQLLLRRKAERPEGSYTGSLFAGGADRILKKIAEEAAEVLLAAKDQARDQVVYEVADLWFHTLVLLAQMGIPPEVIAGELARREGKRKPDYGPQARAEGQTA